MRIKWGVIGCGDVAEHKGGPAIEQAGKELALFGEISKKTQKIASQDIIPIPFFSILKNFKWFKKIAIEKIKD